MIAEENLPALRRWPPSLRRPASSPRALVANVGFDVPRLLTSIDLTVSELTTAAGISAGLLSKSENGSAYPSSSIGANSEARATV
jgi:hypothetical protein